MRSSDSAGCSTAGEENLRRSAWRQRPWGGCGRCAGSVVSMFNVGQQVVCLSWHASLTCPKRGRMERDYDLFEVLPDGAVVWQETVSGHENAIRKLVELSKRTTNEVRVMEFSTNSLIGLLKGPQA